MEPSPQAHKNSPPLYFLSILDKYLIIDIESEYSTLVLVDDSYEAVKTFTYRRDNYFDFVLFKPLIYDQYRYILKDNNYLYITYAINNSERGLLLNNGLVFEEMDYDDYDKYNIVDNTVVQYTIKVNYKDLNVAEEKISTYNFADYIKDKD